VVFCRSLPLHRFCGCCTCRFVLPAVRSFCCFCTTAVTCRTPVTAFFHRSDSALHRSFGSTCHCSFLRSCLLRYHRCVSPFTVLDSRSAACTVRSAFSAVLPWFPVSAYHRSAHYQACHLHLPAAPAVAVLPPACRGCNRVTSTPALRLDSGFVSGFWLGSGLLRSAAPLRCLPPFRILIYYLPAHAFVPFLRSFATAPLPPPRMACHRHLCRSPHRSVLSRFLPAPAALNSAFTCWFCRLRFVLPPAVSFCRLPPYATVSCCRSAYLTVHHRLPDTTAVLPATVSVAHRLPACRAHLPAATVRPLTFSGCLPQPAVCTSAARSCRLAFCAPPAFSGFSFCRDVLLPPGFCTFYRLDAFVDSAGSTCRFRCSPPGLPLDYRRLTSYRHRRGARSGFPATCCLPACCLPAFIRFYLFTTTLPPDLPVHRSRTPFYVLHFVSGRSTWNTVVLFWVSSRSITFCTTVLPPAIPPAFTCLPVPAVSTCLPFTGSAAVHYSFSFSATCLPFHLPPPHLSFVLRFTIPLYHRFSAPAPAFAVAWFYTTTTACVDSGFTTVTCVPHRFTLFRRCRFLRSRFCCGLPTCCLRFCRYNLLPGFRSFLLPAASGYWITAARIPPLIYGLPGSCVLDYCRLVFSAGLLRFCHSWFYLRSAPPPCRSTPCQARQRLPPACRFADYTTPAA